MTTKARKRNVYPEGWDRNRVRSVLAYYENQSEEEAVREDEAAFKGASKIVTKVLRRPR